MRGVLVAAALSLGAPQMASAQLRAPSCEVLIAFAQGARRDIIEMSFGKPIELMTADDFATAITTVSGCIDATQAGPADVPGLTPRERKSSQIRALTVIAEDLALYRNRQREQLRRVAQ